MSPQPTIRLRPATAADAAAVAQLLIDTRRRFYARHGFVAVRFTDGRENEEQCPDVLYECTTP